MPKRLIACAFAIAGLFVLAREASARRPVDRITAKAALVVDNTTGQVLLARNPDLQLPPASTTKILSAVVALSSGRLNESVWVSRYASSMEPSKIGLQPGWSMNVLDLVYAILLSSANDASVALAEGLAGSVPAFARKMNETAWYIGARRSRFANPSGLPAEGHYSTARDLVLIMQHGLRFKHLREILSTRTATVRPQAGSTRRIALRSHNRLLGVGDVQVIGKTGWTRKAKRCFVGAANAGGRQIVFSVLGSTDLWGDVQRLIDHGLPRSSPRRLGPTEADWQEVLVRSEEPAAQSAEGDIEESERRGFRYQVQLASFRGYKAAQALQRKVTAQGYRAVVERVRTRRGRTMYRVTVPGFSSRNSAREVAQLLAKAHRIQPLIVAVRT
jgi:D-alanyl-D-alanine carboxypeptidase (penicillin-binding protein 5/6)